MSTLCIMTYSKNLVLSMQQISCYFLTYNQDFTATTKVRPKLSVWCFALSSIYSGSVCKESLPSHTDISITAIFFFIRSHENLSTAHKLQSNGKDPSACIPEPHSTHILFLGVGNYSNMEILLGQKRVCLYFSIFNC